MVIGLRARGEFTADIHFIRRESLKGARTVLRAVNAAIQLLRFNPERGHVDTDASGVPAGATAFKLSRRKYVIRYLYPVKGPSGRGVLLILSIRHGARLPIGDEEFLRRYAAEQARLLRAR